MACLVAQAENDLPAGLKRTYAPRDAALAAFMDLAALPQDQWKYTVYVWDVEHAEKSAAAINFGVNSILSRTTRILAPEFNADRRLLRYNLRAMVPNTKDFDRLLKVWESLVDRDPVFRQPDGERRTKKVIKTGKVTRSKPVREAVTPYVATDGKVYDWRVVYRDETEEVPIETQEIVTAKTAPGIHAGGAGPLRLLQTMTGMEMPIVASTWLIPTMWTSIEIGGIKGSYYELAGIDSADGQNDEARFLNSVGADPALVHKLSTDQRAVMISRVTDNWRMIEGYFSVGVRPDVGPSIITITHDLKDSETGAKRHPLLNLLTFEDQAREIIAAKRNGLWLYFLSNGRGERQAEAPEDIAAWPGSPHNTKRLTAGISCLQCHGPQGGYNPFENEVRKLIRDGVFPVADFGSKDAAREVQEQLLSKYDGDLDIPLKVAANGMANAVDRATWGVFGGRSYEGAAAETFRMYSDWFKPITAHSALRTLGYDCDPKDATRLLMLVLPPKPDDVGFLYTLRGSGPRKIRHTDWWDVYFEAANRDAFRPAFAVPPARAGIPFPLEAPPTKR